MSFNAVEYLTQLVNDSDVDECRGITVEEAISWLDEQGLRYEFEERSAILEYDGGLSRDDADVQALVEIKHRIQLLGGDEIC
jgi:hypothetical protein